MVVAESCVDLCVCAGMCWEEDEQRQRRDNKRKREEGGFLYTPG